MLVEKFAHHNFFSLILFLFILCVIQFKILFSELLFFLYKLENEEIVLSKIILKSKLY